MSALVGIGWFVALVVSGYVVLMFVGNLTLVDMFPEGHRWWMWWARLGSLALFAAVILANPFTGFLAHA